MVREWRANGGKDVGYKLLGWEVCRVGDVGVGREVG